MTELSTQRLLALALVPAAAAVAAYFALAWIPSVFFDGLVLPSGHDACYHARRILDALDAPWAVAQFDPKIHAPGGSWVPWPWGFDALMAAIAALLRGAAGVEPIWTLVFIPPAWLLLNAALLVAACRELRLPPAAQWIAALCFAFSPLTQNLHGVGAIDHHFAEYTFVLATLWAGLRCLDQPGRALPAAVLGCVLGAANAVHNGLFLLQLPVLATVALLWLKGAGLGARESRALAASLLGTTLLVALPADALRAGVLQYELLSWFHVYAAGLSALFVLLLARATPGWAALGRCLLICALAALPLARQVAAGLGFVTAEVYRDWQMPEMLAPLADPRWAWQEYSGLVFLLPLGLVAAVVAAARSADRRVVYLCTFSLFGGALLLLQYRFHQFGSFALYLLPLALLTWRVAPGRPRQLALLAFAGVAAIAHAPALSNMTDRLPPPGGSQDFALTRSLYPALAEACARRPGIVLADHNDGHYVRFFTECSVVANNLVLSRESWDKLYESRRLLALEPAALPREAPWVSYVLVRREDNVFDPGAAQEVLAQNGALRGALLLAPPPWPPGYTLLAEVRLDAAGGPAAVVARLFELEVSGPYNGAPKSAPAPR